LHLDNNITHGAIIRPVSQIGILFV
jgi:hypothetical protein